MAVQTISLDFWGTLVQANPDFKLAKIKLIQEHFHVGLDPEVVTEKQRIVKRYYDNLVEAWGIQPTQATLFGDWFHQLELKPEKYSFNHLLRFVESYQAMAYRFPAVPYDEAITGNLRALARDFRLVLISNTLFISGATIRAWLYALGWSEYFDQVIFSDEVASGVQSLQIWLEELSTAIWAGVSRATISFDSVFRVAAYAIQPARGGYLCRSLGLSLLLVKSYPPPSNPFCQMAITLQKRGDKHQINLSKEQKVQLKVDVNLNWNSGEAKSTGLFGKLFGGGAAAAPDLDLGCMYELNDGSKGVIQPLGGNF
nr:hypothetical protein [Tanacetum cinerariifolium]